jgi:hypothetical protein
VKRPRIRGEHVRGAQGVHPAHRAHPPHRDRRECQRGATLAMAMVLLTLVTLLGLAGANAAHVELALAQNEQFRENAASAASAGIEIAIGRIVTSSAPEAVPAALSAALPGSHSRFEAVIRFVGFDRALPQQPGARLAGAHFEVVSTGFAARHAVDRQRAQVLLVVDAPADVTAAHCAPLVPHLSCLRRGQLKRVAWQRTPVD